MIDPVAVMAAELFTWSAAALERGRAAWPDLVVTQEELARFAALRRAQATDEASGDPDALDAAELYLAVACVRGDAAAMQCFRSRYFEPLAPSLRRLGLGDAQRDDVWQTLCERLLVSTDRASPRIVTYAGSGELSGLVRVAATRLALNWRRQDWRRVSDEWLEDLPGCRSDPELRFMKEQHQAELKEELEAVLATLTARERMFLRLHLVERLGIDAVARVCGVHRATAARRISRSKERLAVRLRERLITRWKVDDGSLPAFKTLLDSQIDLSLERLLAAE